MRVHFPPCTGDGTGAGNFHELMAEYVRGKFPDEPRWLPGQFGEAVDG